MDTGVCRRVHTSLLLLGFTACLFWINTLKPHLSCFEAMCQQTASWRSKEPRSATYKPQTSLDTLAAGTLTRAGGGEEGDGLRGFIMKQLYSPTQSSSYRCLSLASSSQVGPSGQKIKWKKGSSGNKKNWIKWKTPLSRPQLSARKVMDQMFPADSCLKWVVSGCKDTLEDPFYFLRKQETKWCMTEQHIKANKWFLYLYWYNGRNEAAWINLPEFESDQNVKLGGDFKKKKMN